MHSNALVKLHDLSAFSEQNLSVEQGLQALAALAAQTLNARYSIVIIREGAEARFREAASFGKSPFANPLEALTEPVNQVLDSARPLLLDEYDEPRAQTPTQPCLICAPIHANGKRIGVLAIADPRYKKRFNGDDLQLLELVALFLGKSLHILQLQHVLNSRFTQIALAQEADRAIGSALAADGENADKVAKILAKSFYREMAKAGFSSNQIIGAASEIIAQLSANLQKHTRRIIRR